MKVYLAGPDVFYKDAKSKFEQKINILNKYNIQGFSPLDNDIPPLNILCSRSELSLGIAKSNEDLMDKCNIILANLELWHGSPSADIGTAFEIGYMSKKYNDDPNNVLIIGYYPNGIPEKFSERVKKIVYKNQWKKENDILMGSDNMIIEDFDNLDNLMLIGAIYKSGGQIYGSFEEAAKNITTQWQQKQNSKL